GNGRASTSLTLGTKAGTQSFSASSAGFGVAISATATAGSPASIAAVSGSGQTDTVKHALKAPLVVRIADKFDNPVPGASVSWTRTAGTGSLDSGASTTGADGQATVTASIANGQSAMFTATGQPGPITKLLFKIQPPATVVAGSSLSTVQVTLLDANDNVPPVSNPVTLGLAGGTAGASLSGT